MKIKGTHWSFFPLNCGPGEDISRFDRDCGFHCPGSAPFNTHGVYDNRLNGSVH